MNAGRLAGFFRRCREACVGVSFTEMKLRFFAALIFFAAVCVLACGCAHQQKKMPAPLHRQLGVIVLVNEDERFVLIDTGMEVEPQPGQALKSFTDGQESGVLTVSPERKAQFVTADIVQGAPQKGDTVVE
jgi:hypothetical protein